MDTREERIKLLEGLLEEHLQGRADGPFGMNLVYRSRHALDKPEGCNCQACTPKTLSTCQCDPPCPEHLCRHWSRIGACFDGEVK
jgi:hypothetical protein